MGRTVHRRNLSARKGGGCHLRVFFNIPWACGSQGHRPIPPLTNKGRESLLFCGIRLFPGLLQSHADQVNRRCGAAGIEEHLAAIREAYGEIAQYQQQSDEVAARQRCPACGTKLPEGSMFCNICGTKLSDTSAGAEKQGQKLCPKCSAVLGADDVFCISCRNR